MSATWLVVSLCVVLLAVWIVVLILAAAAAMRSAQISRQEEQEGSSGEKPLDAIHERHDPESARKSD